MDKITFLRYLEGTKVTGHLIIAYLALLRINTVDINLFFNDGGSHKVPIKITDLLRQIHHYEINSFDKKIKYLFELEPAINLLESSDKETIIQMFFGLALQIPIVRSFELIKSYAIETGQIDKFKKQDWYDVANAIRNCFSHDFRLDVYEKRIKDLPFTWRGISITKAMLGKPISHSDIRIGQFTDLHTAMVESGKDFD